MTKDEQEYIEKNKAELERIKMRMLILEVRKKQFLLEQRYKNMVSDDEWLEYCRNKERIHKEIEERYNKHHDPRNGQFARSDLV